MIDFDTTLTSYSIQNITPLDAESGKPELIVVDVMLSFAPSSALPGGHDITLTLRTAATDSISALQASVRSQLPAILRAGADLLAAGA